ncbi:MAG: AAA family ATPase [Deltaproteobacteria bacterium]|nr:AAA family ATPase [Deltaproteobacteria bacterium]
MDRERLPHINFEDERLAGLQAKDLHLVIEEYYRCYPAFRGQETVTWCFDEIQVVPGWERFVRRLLDTERWRSLLAVLRPPCSAARSPRPCAGARGKSSSIPSASRSICDTTGTRCRRRRIFCPRRSVRRWSARS